MGLNDHFPRCILYGPLDLGGMGLPCLQMALAIIRINYFLYHTRQQTEVGQKLEISVAHVQMESGLDVHFFTTSYATYGHLVTKSMVKCLWSETNPYDMYLCGHSSISWMPKLQGQNDFALMSYAIHNFNNEDTIKINRSSIYLQVILASDLLTFDCRRIHPDLLRHTPIFYATATLNGFVRNGLQKPTGISGTNSRHQ
jgi:hypothetical protein